MLLAQVQALWHARALWWVMTRREITARYAGTAAGVLWAYVQPLLTVAAYYVVFDIVFAMRLGDNAPTPAVGAFLIVGALPWMAFCDALSRGMLSLVEAGGVLQKNALPPVLFPARSVLASMLVHGPLLLALALAYGPQHHFGSALLVLPILVGLQFLLSLVLGYALAILMAALRDTAQIVAFVLSVGIFMSPILFPLTMFPEAWRWVLWLNPMTALVLSYQAVLLQGVWPSILAWAAIAAWLAGASLLLAVLLRRSRDQLVDWL
ncbi:ABC transporter permease [Acidovorax sp.]|uniref:ABC transporter permease n=1 Tax=Acidovorax sp. TaxID=1872122 RepID=UPI0040381BD2